MLSVAVAAVWAVHEYRLHRTTRTLRAAITGPTPHRTLTAASALEPSSRGSDQAGHAMYAAHLPQRPRRTDRKLAHPVPHHHQPRKIGDIVKATLSPISNTDPLT
jgi:hypothetical protein